jgi:hypothetical protein
MTALIALLYFFFLILITSLNKNVLIAKFLNYFILGGLLGLEVDNASFKTVVIILPSLTSFLICIAQTCLGLRGLQTSLLDIYKGIGKSEHLVYTKASTGYIKFAG